LRARRGTGVAVGAWLRCTGNVPVVSTTSTHLPVPASASAPACRPGISRNLLRTAPTGRRVRGVALTWHFMPGWWNWPYRPKTQGGSAGRMEGRIIRGWRSDCGPIGRQARNSVAPGTALQVPRCRCHAPQGRYRLRFPATAHLISQVSATAGTVPGNGAVVAVSGDSSDCDDSTVQPAAAGAQPPLCPRGVSPVLHQMMRIPIKSLGFSLPVPCVAVGAMHLRAVTSPFCRPRPTSFPRCLRLRGLSPATAQSLRFLGTLRIVTILPFSQRPLVHACRRARRDCPRCCTK